jgi:hypothetical protein
MFKIRKFLRYRKQNTQLRLRSVHQSEIASRFSLLARIYKDEYSIRPAILSGTSFADKSADKVNAEDQLLLSTHPFFGAELCGSGNETRSCSMNGLTQLIDQSKSPSVSSEFVHVDLLLRRQKKCQLTLLVDMQEVGSREMRGFFIAPIDSRVSRSIFGQSREYGKTMMFPELADRIERNETVEGHCSECGKVTRFAEKDFPKKYICMYCKSPPGVTIAGSINPGGNRHYYGPAVPSLRNVWYGMVDKFVNKASSNCRVGIIHSTVYQIFKDPSAGKESAKLPVPDPRIQWCMLPVRY